jgi:spoIIIJ-associated protein
MESLEASGKTVEEAVETALQQMGYLREEVEVTVLSKGKSGFLGLGSEEARVLVTPVHTTTPTDPDKVTEIAREVLERLLDLMETPGRVEVNSVASVSTEAQLPSVTLNIRGEDLGILIGRRGQTLASLQHIVRLIVARRLRCRADLVVDVEEYKERHFQSLRTLATRMAQKVESSGQSITLEPMPANERRIVHLALADHPAVITQSTGDRDIRKVVIIPKSRQRPSI